MMKDEITKELAELIGILLSDGTVDFHKLPSGEIRERIRLSAVDESFAKRFQELCTIVFGKTPKIKTRKRKAKHSIIFEIGLTIPKGKEAILNKWGFFTIRIEKEKVCVIKSKIPEEIVDGNEEVKRSFLKAFATAEGSVHLIIDRERKWWVINRYVQIRCCHPLICKQLMVMLESLGIHPHLADNRIKIKGRENLERFQKLIGFLDGCRVTKKSNEWQGVEKNKLLDLCIKLFEIEKKVIQKMNKKEILTWLKLYLRPERSLGHLDQVAPIGL